MSQDQLADRLVALLTDTMTALVSGEDKDLTSRQTAILLACNLRGEPQTVRGLARDLNISKPAVTRAVDKLEGLHLVARKDDPEDRRSVHVQGTEGGKEYIARLRDIMGRAAGSIQVARAA